MNRKNRNSVASFGDKANDYETHAFVQSDAAKWLAEWILSINAKNCLELGAGTGLLTQFLIDRFEYLECSDIEPKMVEFCRKKFPTIHNSIRDAWVAQPDVGKWDLVTASSVLQWAKDPESTMQNWLRLLTPDGRIVVGLFIQPSLPEMSQVTGVESPLIWRDEAVWQSLFQSAGLHVVRMESKTERYYYKSALDFWKSIHGTGSAVSRKISPSQMMRFFREYESQFHDAKGVYATWTFCRAELKKATN